MIASKQARRSHLTWRREAEMVRLAVKETKASDVMGMIKTRLISKGPSETQSFVLTTVGCEENGSFFRYFHRKYINSLT